MLRPIIRGLNRVGQVLVVGRGTLILPRLHPISIVAVIGPICSRTSHVLGRTARVLLRIHHEASADELLVRVVVQLVGELRAVLIHLSQIRIQVKVVSLIEDYWLARVETEHVRLANIKAARVHHLGRVGDSATHGGPLARGSLAMTTAIRERRARSSLLRKDLPFLILCVSTSLVNSVKPIAHLKVFPNYRSLQATVILV